MVGLTAINALAEKFVLTSYRTDGKKKSIIFNEGKLVDTIESKCEPDEHGTLCVFKPNPKYLGKNCKIIPDDLFEWIHKLSYQLPPEITLQLNSFKKNKNASQHTVLRNKHGMYDYLKKYGSNLTSDPIHILDKCNVQDTILENGERIAINRFLGIEVAFALTTDDQPFVDSFCNFVNTIDGGMHIEAAQEAVCRYLYKQTKNSLSEKEKEKYEIKMLDIFNSLSIAVNVQTDLDPSFRGQTKDKVGNEDMKLPIKNMIYNNTKKYYESKQKELKSAINLIKNIAKARYESTKIKNSVIKGKTSSLDEHKIKKFRPASNRTGKELFITEGDSAMGSANTARNPKTQAIFALRGVPKNTFNCSIDQVLDNEEMSSLITIIGTNTGYKFNIKSLKYDKIIIMTDSDIDGFNITSLLCAFFMRHMPELVRAGKIYKVLPPLYKLETGDFAMDKKEYFEMSEKRISRSVKLFTLSGRQLSKDEIKLLLMKNRNYLNTLEIIADSFTTTSLFIEFLVRHRESDNFRELLKKNYPEIKVSKDGKLITGIVENKKQCIRIDYVYYDIIKPLEKFIFDINEGNIYYKVIEIDKRNGDIDRGVLSLGGLFKLSNKYIPKIDIRYKGLGELSPNILWETAMNPLKRTLLRLTVQDMERELEVFDMLHGKDEGNKEMMKNYKIDREDLDN